MRVLKTEGRYVLETISNYNSSDEAMKEKMLAAVDRVHEKWTKMRRPRGEFLVEFVEIESAEEL